MRRESYQPRVATLIEPSLRERIDAAAGTDFRTLHAVDARAAYQAVRERPTSAFMISPSCVRRDQVAPLRRIMSAFPGVPTVAVVASGDECRLSAGERLLQLGAIGVRQVVDLSRREGWHQLRLLISRGTAPGGGRVLEEVLPALGCPSLDTARFFETTVRLAPITPTVRLLGRRVGVQANTLMTKFVRAGLPTPKRYLSGLRLVYAASLFETPGLSIADVSYRLAYSSPQSFGRHVRATFGMTAGEYRERSSFETTIRDFNHRFIIPYRAAFRTFHPF